MKNSITAYAATTVLYFSILGTGGIHTSDNLQRISEWDNTNLSKSVSSYAHVASPAEQIKAIRNTLSLNMSDLAALLHVSRPTAYSWMDGKEPKSEAQKNIANLIAITDKIDALNIMRMDLLIRRPIFDGKSLLDKILAQEDVTQSLQILKNISEKEFANRHKNKVPSKNVVTLNEAASRKSTPIYRD